MKTTCLLLPPREKLKEILDYNPETGEFRWKKGRGPARAGEVAGSLDRKGYRIIGAYGKLYLAHRLAWKMHYGKEPENFIDHINRVTTDNSISNLREATHRQNMCNQPAKARNLCGVKGVFWHARNKKWVAAITHEQVKSYLGSFKTIEDAAAAYARASDRLHGEFARIDAPPMACQHASS